MAKTKVPGTENWYKIHDTPDRITYARSGKVTGRDVIAIQRILGTPKIIPGDKTIYVVSTQKGRSKTFYKKSDAKAYAKTLMK